MDKSINQKEIKKFIKNYTVFTVFFNLLLWIPIFYEFQKISGLSDSEIFNIQSLYYLAFVMLELPSGALGDYLGPAKTLRLGSLFLVFANAIPLFWTTPLSFLIHFFTIALARSLISGSASAYLYEKLKELGIKNQTSDLYKKAEGKARFWSLIARICAWPAVGFLMSLWAPLPYFVTVINAAIAVFITLKFSPLKNISIIKNQNLKTVILDIYFSFKKSPLLLTLMFQGTTIFILQRVCLIQLLQPILKAKQFPLTSFGIILSVATIFEAIGAKNSHLLKKRLKDYQAVYLSGLIVVLGLAGLILKSQVFCIISLCFFSLGIGLAFPIQRQLLNDHIVDARFRATLLSVESLFNRLIAAGITVYIGKQIGQDKLVILVGNAAALSLFAISFIFMLIFLNRKKLYQRVLNVENIK